MAPSPPLPFGLGRDPICSPSHCLQPTVPLPRVGNQLHDSLTLSLSKLFLTFYNTSLRYLGTSEILDWVESNRTVEAWILTGLEQGHEPDQVANEKNVQVGREAIRNVIVTALEADDLLWATSLREVGFSSGMSMAYEGIVSQLRTSKNSPVPCLHTLLTPSGLSILKSAPLKHSFPICPPRQPPSPSSLLTSIRNKLASKEIKGPMYKSGAVWKPLIRKAYGTYHQVVKEVAEEIISDAAFSKEYTIFLESISQPVQLFQLIADDFENEFGPNVVKGLLGVGEVGGDNLISIMDFCAAGRPSELLKRVKLRVKEKQEREKRKEDRLRKEARVKQLEDWFAQGGVNEGARKEVAGLKVEIEEDLKKEKEEEMKIKEREKLRTLPQMKQVDSASKENQPFVQGSSKDLLKMGKGGVLDPFSSSAPRATSPSPQSKKGKGKAIVSRSTTRSSSKYAPRLPLRSSLSQASFPATPTSDSRPSSPVVHATPPRTASPGSGSAEEDDEGCCAACAALDRLRAPSLNGRSMSGSTQTEETGDMGEAEVVVDVEVEVQVEAPTRIQEEEGEGESGGGKKKKKRKKNKKAAAQPAPIAASTPTPTKPVTSTAATPRGGASTAQSQAPRLERIVTGPPNAFLPLSRYPAPQCCPPDRCTREKPNHYIWPELDGILYDLALVAFKYELLCNFPEPLEMIRDTLAKQYLLKGGRMCSDDGKSRDINPFMQQAEKGMWTSVCLPEVSILTTKYLASSLGKLIEVFRAQLGDICICRLSNNPEILMAARHRLLECEFADRELVVELPPMDQQSFMKWCHVQLREKKLSGPEWEGSQRSYRVDGFLLSFTDAFNHAIDRMMDEDPYRIASDIVTLIEWQGGVRTFEAGMRWKAGSIPIYSMQDAPEKRPLQAWNHLLELSRQARASGHPFTKDLAESEKQKGNALFTEQFYLKSLVSFETASIINPTDCTYWTNSAASRLKLGQFSEAILDCTYALYYDPKNIKGLYRRGTALAMLKKWDQAIIDLTELVRVCPDNQPAKDALNWVKTSRK